MCPLVLETFGGFHPDAARLVETLARKHGARLGADELSAPWNARSFRTLRYTCSAYRSLFSSPQLRKSWIPSSSTEAPQ